MTVEVKKLLRCYTPRNDTKPPVIANAVKRSIERLPRADALAMTENVKRLLRRYTPRNDG